MPRVKQLTVVLLSALAVNGYGAECGTRINMYGRLAVSVDGNAMAIRSPLEVNPDGTAASYTEGDHGFTYIANGLRRVKTGNCNPGAASVECRRLFLEAEKARFVKGTEAFCSFAIEVDPLEPGGATTACEDGKLLGNGYGQPRRGNPLRTVANVDITPYVSATALKHKVGGEVVSVDSATVPTFVIPKRDSRFQIGQLAAVRSTAHPDRWFYAVAADKGPPSKFGEGSIALNQLLHDGKIHPTQAPGPVPREMRCELEDSLRPPFQSKANAKDDPCSAGHLPKDGSDIRAYAGHPAVDFIILPGKGFSFQGKLVNTELTQKSIENAAIERGYDKRKLDQMARCLN